MIHGNRQARTALQSRALVGLGIALALFLAAVLAAGVATVEFAVPWKGIAILVTCALAFGYRRLRR